MPRNLSALGNMAAWVTSLVSSVKPRIDKIGGWVDGWDKEGEITAELHPKDGYFEVRIKLPKKGQDDE